MCQGNNAVLRKFDLGKPIHTLAPCWMPKPSPPKKPMYGLVRPHREVCGHSRLRILVILNVAGYMLTTSSGFATLFTRGIFLHRFLSNDR